MLAFLTKLLPVILLFGLGMLVRRLRVFTAADARMLLKLVLYIALPSYSALAVYRMLLTPDVLLLPLIAGILVVLGTGVGWAAGRVLHLPPRTLGAFIAGSAIMNVSFAIPFVAAGYGDEGYARLAVFNFGNLFVISTFVYGLCVKYGSEGGVGARIWLRVLSLPPVWGLACGLAFNMLHVPLPEVLTQTLQYAADTTIPLTMIALGMMFELSWDQAVPLVTVQFLRTGMGLLFGFILVSIFHLQGLSRAIVLVSAASPAGYNAVVYSTLENLDVRFAANLVSVSLILGIFYMPLLIMLIG